MQRTSRLLSKNLAPDDLAAAIWPAAVGKRLAARTGNLTLYGTKLVVDVDDNIWKQQLSTLSSQILTKIQKIVPPGRITQLEFRVGPPRRAPRLALTVDGANDPADGIADPIFRHLYLASRAQSEREEAERLRKSA